MPLGQGIGEMWDAVRDRVEVGGHGPTWQVTAGSFDSALAYAREAFGDVTVLTRRDRDRWWPRVTLTVTTDATTAATAPPLEDLARPAVPAQATAGSGGTGTERERTSSRRERTSRRGRGTGELPASLEAIFAHQEELRLARQRIPEQGGRAPAQNRA